MKKEIELLLPAGNYECAVAAINNGADAIYIGGKQFSARAFADNFSLDEIKDLVRYAHIRNVKVYVGINTMIKEDMFYEAISFIKELYFLDIDALIVADLGLIAAISNIFPGLRIHVSTQFNVCNLWTIKFLEKYHVKRIVLARETSISTIKYLLANTNIELEVFAHGALCVCYSGNCLHSSMIGKRSGNSGSCAQPCRMEYSLVEDGNAITPKKYLLSMKDLNTLDHLDELKNLGISSLKIEGRMKSKEYVSIIARSYYNRLHNIKDLYSENDLKQVFNREFTKGYLFNENNKNIVNTYRPNHIGLILGHVIKIEDSKVLIRLEDDVSCKDKIAIISKRSNDVAFYLNKISVKGKLVGKAYKNEVIEIHVESKIDKDAIVYKLVSDELMTKINNNTIIKKIPLDVRMQLQIGSPIKVITSSITLESEYVIERAKNEVDDNVIIKNFDKFTSSAYSLNSLEIISDHQGLIPSSVLNDLRRELITKLDDSRANVHHRENDVIDIEKAGYILKPIKKNNLQINVKVRTLDQLKAISTIDGINKIYFNNREDYEAACKLFPHKNIILSLNRIIDDRKLYDYRQYLVSNYGDLIKQEGSMIDTDFYLNIASSYTISELLSLGVKQIGMSLELSFADLKNIVEEFTKKYGFIPPLEAMVYGRVETMLSKHCVVSESKGFDRKMCGSCKEHKYELVDRFNYIFPLQFDENCNMTILNSKKLHMIDYLEKFSELNISYVRLDFTDESSDEVYCVTKAYVDRLNDQCSTLKIVGATYGYYLDNEKNNDIG